MKITISPLLRALQRNTLLLFLLVFSLSAFTGNSYGSTFNISIKLNPECKIKRMSNGSVIVSAKNEEGVEVKHQFTDFCADLLMSVYRKQSTAIFLDSVAKKYYLSQDDCRRELKHAVNVLSEWNIILHDDTMASR
jgi:hypothetical protein